VYRKHPLIAGCRCSRERVAQVLRAMPEEELAALQAEGEALVTCEFCSRSIVSTARPWPASPSSSAEDQ
jgi:Disulfide bond chaperones of the HSP33 family